MNAKEARGSRPMGEIEMSEMIDWYTAQKIKDFWMNQDNSKCTHNAEHKKVVKP